MSQHESAPARPLYDEVERIRLRNGWTKTQLARIAGVGRNTIDNWKTQPRAPLAPTVKDVAERLGIEADLALRLAGIAAVEPTSSDPQDPVVAELTERLERLEQTTARHRQENDELRRMLREITGKDSGSAGHTGREEPESDRPQQAM